MIHVKNICCIITIIVRKAFSTTMSICMSMQTSLCFRTSICFVLGFRDANSFLQENQFKIQLRSPFGLK